MMNSPQQVPIIYNLFPRLAGIMPSWREHIERAVSMGFNWLFINPVLYPGFSGSLYAVKDYYRINPDFLPPGAEGDGLPVLEQLLRTCNDMGISPIMDLVINHTAMDNPLTQTHPNWYVRDDNGKIISPFARDPDDPEKITVWGDLAEIDNENSSDKQNLWNYWTDLVLFYLKLGFTGFRCDAAYKVPAELWTHLISEANKIATDTVFFAEILGGAKEETLVLQDAGLHYFFNSSKWWDFTAPWCLQQHEEFGQIAPSISFPETHDTSRLAADTDGNEALQRQRYIFSAIFSAGLMMPIGYEFGFKKQLHVVNTHPDDWETPSFNLVEFIRRVNRFKIEHQLFHGEGHFKEIINNDSILILERSNEQLPRQKGWILVNKDQKKQVSPPLKKIILGQQHRFYRLCSDTSPITGEPVVPQNLILYPSEVAIIC